MAYSTFYRSLLVATTLVAASHVVPAFAAGDLRIGLQTDIASFDPTRLNASTAVTNGLLFDTLITLDADRKPAPALAESWAFSDDGRVLTLHLRKGVVFHDGRALTSKDVKFSFDYAATPKVGANILPFTKLVQKLETPDDQTVVLHLNASQNVIFDLLDLLFVIDSAHPDEIHTSGNGTGPFRLESYEPGQNAIFVRNEKYWSPAPAIDSVEVKILPDSQAAVAQLRAGTIDFLPAITTDNLAQLSKLHFKTGIASKDSYVYDIGIQVQKPPFDKPEVREAVSLAIDRARVAKELGGDSSVVRCLPWSDRGGKSESELCPYDPARARDLIEKAGAKGATVEILGGGESDSSLATLSQIMQASLADVGLTAKITDLSNSAFVSEFRKGNFQLTSHKYGRASRSPEALLLSAVVFWSEGNVMGLNNPQYGKDVQNVITATKPDETTVQAWKGIDKALLSDRWVLPLATQPTYWASSPKLDGVHFTLDGSPLFGAATLQ
jgi:peptide/nickel transport system substrate-binding protein